MNNKKTIHKLETWLLEGSRMHRPMSRETLSVGDFIDQQMPGIEYTVYRRMKEVYGDALDGAPLWQKVRVEALTPGAAKRYAVR